jgi:DNA-binding NarL/FixJ family response regulator
MFMVFGLFLGFTNLILSSNAALVAYKDIPLSPVADTNDLSRREVEVLRSLAQGLTNEQIAHSLFLSTNTVRAHLYSIYSKLGVSNRGAAIRFAYERKLL